MKTPFFNPSAQNAVFLYFLDGCLISFDKIKPF
jgi:hypothetical protein